MRLPSFERTRASVSLLATVVVTALAMVGSTLVLSPSPASAASTDLTAVVDEAFSTQESADAFRPAGAGRWRVADGRYELRRGVPARRGEAISVHRTAVRSDEWRLLASVRALGKRPDLSVIVRYRGQRRYTYVHLDHRQRRSGVYEVRRGVRTRVLDLPIGLAAGRSYDVELRGRGTALKMYLSGPGVPRRYLGRTELVGGPRAVRAGFGSWRSPLRVDDLQVLVPGDSTEPPPPPAGDGDDVSVATSDQLTAALADAQPGDVITMAAGVYTSRGVQAPLEIGGKRYYGTFVAAVPGTPERPIVLRGPRDAVIDGKPGGAGTGTQYGLYLAGADHWRVEGITVTNVSKGIVLDRSSSSVISDVHVHQTGQEGIHLRSFSSDNVVQSSLVERTGLKNATYGEGIYVGSAKSNWSTYSDGRPDASDRNLVVDNVIRETGAESIDIKEGTTGGEIRGNTFDGTGMTGSWADSWIDLKGNSWLVVGNTGENAKEDGFQVHGALPGWGSDNIFRRNTARVRGPGYGFWLQNNVTGNLVECTNTVTQAEAGFANLPCS